MKMEIDKAGFGVNSCRYCVHGSHRYFLIKFGNRQPKECKAKRHPRKGNCLALETCENFERGENQFRK